MTRRKAESSFFPMTQIGPTISDSGVFQPFTGRPTVSGPVHIHHRQRIALAVGEKSSPQLSSFLGSRETARGQLQECRCRRDNVGDIFKVVIVETRIESRSNGLYRVAEPAGR
jgi:hypothetical protein